MLQGNGSTFIGDHCLRRVDNGLQNPFQVQGGGDLLANGHQHFQNLYFALRLQKPGIVQGNGSGFGNCVQQEQVVFVERTAVHFVDGFDDPHLFFMGDQRANDSGKWSAFDPGWIPPGEPFVLCIINEQGLA